MKELGRSNLPISLCTACSTEVAEPTSLSTVLCKADYHGSRVSPVSTGSVRALTSHRFRLNFHASACIGDPESGPSTAPCDSGRSENPGETWSIIGTTSTSSSSERTTTLQVAQSVSKPHSMPSQDSGSHIENRWWLSNLFSWSQYAVAHES
eukprot:Gb_33578 [translate_table: standard]